MTQQKPLARAWRRKNLCRTGSHQVRKEVATAAAWACRVACSLFCSPPHVPPFARLRRDGQDGPSRRGFVHLVVTWLFPAGSSKGSNPPRSRLRGTRTGERPGHDDLPAELYVRIFSFVPCIDRLAAVALVCRRWSVLALDHRLHPPACLARGVSRADVCPQAAKSGHRHCLQRAHEGGFPWDEWTCAAAALNGHLECLAYAHANGCPWDGGTCASAALNGHLECLAYAHANGCPWRGLATY